MTKKMKSELINDILMGLLVSAAFAAVCPDSALADNLVTVAGKTKEQVGAPFNEVVSYISYGLGTVLTVAGIAGAKKHADNPTATPLNPALGKLGAGAALLAAPSVIGMLQTTGSATLGAESNGASVIKF